LAKRTYVIKVTKKTFERSPPSNPSPSEGEGFVVSSAERSGRGEKGSGGEVQASPQKSSVPIAYRAENDIQEKFLAAIEKKDLAAAVISENEFGENRA
jgi:hypothetical protein